VNGKNLVDFKFGDMVSQPSGEGARRAEDQ
jgi:hypothetical protein